MHAWSFSNKNPKYGILGITFTPNLPTGGAGHLFDDENDTPHREYGIAGGLDYWKRYGRTYDAHLGFDVKYQQYHFHYGEDEANGKFPFLHFSIPASLNYPIPNYSYMFFKLGASISSANLFQSRTGYVGNNKYLTTFKTLWLIYPEISLGIDLLEEKKSKFYFNVGLDYTFIPVPKMGTFSAAVSDDGIIHYKWGSFTPNKFQIRIAFYPIWKKKTNILKNGHNCPDPF